MSKNKVVRNQLQILNEPKVESLQLDLLSFVSDYAMADLSPKAKQERISIAKNNIVKNSVYHFQGNVDKNKTFSNFCLGNSNQFVVEAVKRFIFNEKSDFNMIYIKSGSGLGKSHILHAVANEMLLSKKSFYLSAPFMMSLLIDNFNSLKHYEIILIDDIEELEGNSELQKIFCQLIDYAQSGRIKLIFTGSKFPKELNGPDNRFKGKLSAALIHNIFEMDQALAFDIVNLKCEILNLALPEKVKELVSNEYNFNTYGIESLLYKLKNIQDIKKQEITLETALQELKIKTVIDHQDNIREILNIVADNFQISLKELISQKRKKEFALARHVAMYLLKEKVGLSLMKIAKVFNKDHSTVIYAVIRIKKEIKNDLKMRNLIQAILSEESIEISDGN